MVKKEKKNLIFKENVFVFLKGFLMGVCDVIPGISGGTIAFITGIYLRLITAIKNITPKNVWLLLKSLSSYNGFKKKAKEMDLYFLSVLFLGIFSAIFLVSKLIGFLLEIYEAYTLTFFVGLIFASSKIIFENIESHKTKDIMFGIIGFVIGISMIFLVPSEIGVPSFFYVVFGGFLAISALFLPGISGSFILLILGLYEFILSALHNIKEDYVYLVMFGIGAVLGAVFISRLITWLYSVNKSRTLYVLLGIVVGSLLVPMKRISLTFDFTPVGALILLGLFFLGVVLVVIVNMFSEE